jgi:hypothetical protein
VLERLEEIPEPDEPDEPREPDEPGDDEASAPVAGMAMPAGGTGPDWEYRVDELGNPVGSADQLARTLNEAAGDGWHLVQILDAGDRKLAVMRRPKRRDRPPRPVGFAPRSGTRDS